MKDNYGDNARIYHILEAIEEIEKYTNQKTYDDFLEDTMLQSACIRQLEIIGEAANHLSTQFKKTLKDVKWREIVSLRNVLIHEYFGVDLNVVWGIIQKDLTQLKINLESFLD